MAEALLALRVVADVTQGERGLAQVEGKLGKTQQALNKVAKPAAVAAGGVLAFAVAATKSASETQQAMGAVEAVFGKNAGTVKRWSDQAAEAVGLSKSEYGNLAVVLGSQLKNMGVSVDQLAPKTNSLIKLGADLSATYGGTAAEAVAALSSTLRGETDPIERYGVSIKQADIKARLAADGQDKLTGKAAKAAAAAATLALISEQTGAAQGQWAKQTNTAAEQQQIAAAKVENLKSRMGTALLPVAVKLATKISELAEFTSRHAKAAQIAAGVIGGLAATLLLANVALRAYVLTTKVANAAQAAFNGVMALGSKYALGTRIQLAALALQQRAAAIATRVMAAAQLLLNLAMSANPLTLVVLAVVALVAVLVIAYKKSDTFRAIVQRAFALVQAAAGALVGFVKRAIPPLFGILTLPWRLALGFIRLQLRAVQMAVTMVVGFVRRVFPAVKGYVTAPFTAARAIVGRAWDGIRGGAQGVIDFVRGIPGKLRDAGGRFAEAGKALIGRFVDGMKNAAGVVTGIAGNVWQAVRGLLNSAISKINSALDFTISLPGPDLHVNIPDIPKLASGGIVRRPTLALIGEAGPEAVVPLGRRGGVGQTTVININVTGALDPDAVARQIKRVLSQSQTRLGARSA